MCSKRILLVVWYTCLSWPMDQTWEIMNACVIMHNLIAEIGQDVGMVFGQEFEYQVPRATVGHRRRVF